MTTRLLEQVREAIVSQQLFPAGSRLIVGVSGGLDSVILLHVLTQLRVAWNLTLHVAHFDHGLRATSELDASFVHELGTHLGLATTVERHDVAGICHVQGWSLEDGARRLRYQFFLNLARRHSATHLALAHTADDQAETVLMRLVRGTGLMGLGAMAATRPLEELWVVRPLLAVWRREIEAYAQETRLTHREDVTNQDVTFVRNRIRHELLPLLERDYNPNIKAALVQLAQQSRWDYEHLQGAAQRQWKRMAKQPFSHQVTIAIQPFLRQPKALQRQLLREAILRVRGTLLQIEFRHWLEAERLFRGRPPGTLLDLPNGLRLRRQEEHVVIERHSAPIPAEADTCSAPAFAVY